MRPADFGELAGHDAYELLGVREDASPEEIRRAHRALVKAGHPDLFPDERAKAEADERIRLLNAARDILGGRRADYDAFRSGPDEVLDDEVLDEEIVDDPWDTAVPGTPPPVDPWSAAEPVEPRYAAPPQMTPPRFVRSPRRPKAMTPRRALLRLGIGCAPIWVLILLFNVGPAIHSALRPSHSGPKPLASVPEALAGAWRGTVRSPTDGKWSTELTLRAGKHNGRVRYLGGKCAGTAVPVSYKAERLTVRTVFSDSGCDAGNIQVTLRKDRRLSVAYHDRTGKVTASGALTPRR